MDLNTASQGERGKHKLSGRRGIRKRAMRGTDRMRRQSKGGSETATAD